MVFFLRFSTMQPFQIGGVSCRASVSYSGAVALGPALQRHMLRMFCTVPYKREKCAVSVQKSWNVS